MTKEQKFYKTLQDVFIGAKIEGEGGFVNLMSIKSNYYRKVETILKEDVEKALEKYPSFRDELLINYIRSSVGILQRADQFILIQPLFITIFTKKFILMRRMLFFFGRHRCFIMLRLIGFSRAYPLSLMVLSFTLMLHK